jgi:hypothetical protein
MLAKLDKTAAPSNDLREINMGGSMFSAHNGSHAPVGMSRRYRSGSICSQQPTGWSRWFCAEAGDLQTLAGQTGPARPSFVDELLLTKLTRLVQIDQPRRQILGVGRLWLEAVLGAELVEHAGEHRKIRWIQYSIVRSHSRNLLQRQSAVPLAAAELIHGCCQVLMRRRREVVINLCLHRSFFRHRRTEFGIRAGCLVERPRTSQEGYG